MFRTIKKTSEKSPAVSCRREWGTRKSAMAITGQWLALFAVCVILALPAESAYAADVPASLIAYPDFIFTNGQVLTADKETDDFTVAEAVAVRGNRILAVGTNADIQALAGPNTRSVDLHGNSLTPGFIYSDGDNSVPAGDLLKDSQWGGQVRPHLNGDTIDQTLANLGKVVAKSKEGEPLFFNLEDQWAGKAIQNWDKNTLDEIAPDNPVVVYLDSSSVMMNSAMIKLAIKKGFPPNDLALDRDANGNPTGKGGAQLAGFIGREVRPWPDADWFDQVAIPSAVKELAIYARNGVTVATGHMSGADMLIMNRLFHDGDGSKLSVRVYPALDFIRQNPQGERYLKRIGNLVDFSLTDDRGPMVTIIGASVGDHSGSPDGATSLLTIEPKKHVIPELSPNKYGWNRMTGQWYNGITKADLTPTQFTQTDYHNIILARKYGWNVSGIHNMGSKGILQAMQIVEQAINQKDMYVKDLWRPYGYDHNIDWMPQDYAYYKAHPDLKGKVYFANSLTTGIMQRDAKPLGLKKVIELQYGQDSLKRMSPLHTLVEKGIPFHIEGSEPKETKQYPTWYMQKAVTRVDDRGEKIAPEEAINRKQAFLALTRWAARFIGAEKNLGSIEPGKLADLVVFDGNLLDVPIDHLSDLKPVMTLVGGKVAYEKHD